MTSTDDFYALEGVAEKALHYLKDTDSEAAKLKANVAYLDEHRKIVKAQEFLKCDGPIGIREQMAIASKAYEQAVLALQLGTEQYEVVKNRRFSAEQQIEIWRSENANRRKGNV